MLIDMRIFIILLAISVQLKAQNPGNIGTDNITAWFKADNLPTGDVQFWESTFPKGANAIIVSDNSTPFPQATNIPDGNSSNYNMTIDFFANTVENPMVLEYLDVLNLLDNNTSEAEGTFFSAHYLPASSESPGCHVVNYREGTFGAVDGLQFRLKSNDNIGRIAIGTGNSSNASRDFDQGFKPDIVSYSGNKSDESSYKAYKRSKLLLDGGASATTGQLGLVIGARKTNDVYNALMDGFIHEIVFYNRDLTNEEMSKVHTYLAVKYGVSLDNSLGGSQGDYISSDGGLVWDASTNFVYHNDVMGIARDDAQGLYQKQSHTFDDSTRIYIQELADHNEANTGIISQDNAYLMLGHNKGQMCGSTIAALESPEALNLVFRIEREWKITSSKFTDDFNCDFTFNSCIDINTLDPERVRLLVDFDGDFTDANAYGISDGLDISNAEGSISIKGITENMVPYNETRYITLLYLAEPSSVDNEQSQVITAFPNPTTGQVHLHTNNIEISNFEIFNHLGEQVIKSCTIIKENDSNYMLDVSNLNTGIYFIRLEHQLIKLIKM